MRLVSLSKIISSEQSFQISIHSLRGARFSVARGGVVHLPSYDRYISEQGNISIEPFSTTRGRVSAVGRVFVDFATLSVSNVVENISLSRYISPICIINRSSLCRFVIFQKSYIAMFELGRIFYATKRVKISASRMLVATTIKSEKHPISDSVFGGILTDANKAKRIYLKQLFYPWVPLERLCYLSPLTGYISIGSTQFCGDNKFQDIIRFHSTWIKAHRYRGGADIGTGFASNAPLITPQPDCRSDMYGDIVDGDVDFVDGDVERVDAGEVVCDSPGPWVFHLANINIASQSQTVFYLASLRVVSFDLERALFDFAFTTPTKSLKRFVSGKITVVPIICTDPHYTIVQLEPYFSPLFDCNFGFVDKGELISLHPAVCYLGDWNDYRNIPHFVSAEGRLRCHITTPISLPKVHHPFLDVQVSIEELVPVDLAPVYSNSLVFDIREKPYVRKDGLYRDIFVDAPDFVAHPKTPWINGDVGLRKIADTRYMGYISNDSVIQAIKIAPSKYNIIDIKWEPIYIQDSHFMLPSADLPYIHVKNRANGDFFIVGVGGSGAGLSHVHYSGYIDTYHQKYVYNVTDEDLIAAAQQSGADNIVDGWALERSILYITSHRYRKASIVLYETMQGAVYSDTAVNDAFLFLKKNERYLDIFSSVNQDTGEARYVDINPTVARGIIDNKASGLSGQDVFLRPNFYNFSKNEENVRFYFQETPIPNGDIEERFVLRTRSAYVVNSHFVLSATTVGKKISSSKFDNIAKLCGLTISCEVGPVQGFESRETIIVKRSQIVVNETIGEYPTVSINDGSFGEPGDTAYLDRDQLSAYTSTHLVTISIISPQLNGVGYRGHLYVANGLSLGGVFAYGRVLLELDTLPPSMYEGISFKYIASNSILSRVLSDFRVKVHVSTSTTHLSPCVSTLIKATSDIGFINMPAVRSQNNAIWMKLFFPVVYDKADMKSKIMEMTITEQEFSLNMMLPYSYVDSHVETSFSASKSSPPALKEKASGKDGGSDQPETIEKPDSAVCGPYRNMTYLDYQGFDYMFSDNINRLWGMISKRHKDIIFSGVSQVIVNDIYTTGRYLSESDILKRNLVDSTIAHIGNLGEALNWDFEEFSLDYEDFEGMVLSREDFDAIDSAFKDSMKFVLHTIGDDSMAYEETNKINAFPDFPDRPIPDNSLSESIKMHQFFIVEVEDV